MSFPRPFLLCAEQARKSLRLCLAGLRIGWFDPIAKASELPDHSCRALLLGLLGDRWTPFFVTDCLVQDQPDQPTLSMSNGPDGLIMSQARYTISKMLPLVLTAALAVWLRTRRMWRLPFGEQWL